MRKRVLIGALVLSGFVFVPAALAAPTLTVGGHCDRNVPFFGLEGPYNLFEIDVSGSGYGEDTVVTLRVNPDDGATSATRFLAPSGAFAFFPYLWVGIPVEYDVLSLRVTATTFDDADGDYVLDEGETLYASMSGTITCHPTLDELLEQALTDAELSSGEASSLFAKVEAAGNAADRDNLTAAIRQLQAFLNELKAMAASGRVSPQLAQRLADAANAKIAELSAP